MMRTMLYNAGLGPEYWSYALIQAVFVKNRLPHAYHDHKSSPFEALTGRKPNLHDIKIFGIKVMAKKSHDRSAKLDDNTSTGIFLHHTATTSINKYLDTSTGREKITSHLEFDEEHFTSAHKPPGSAVLLRQGYKTNSTHPTNGTTADTNITMMDHDIFNDPATDTLQIQRLSEHATVPTQATTGPVGLDLYSANAATVAPGEIHLIPTDIAVAYPNGTYGRIAPRSGMTIKRKLDVRAGVIDSDYRGDILVALQNIGTTEQHLPSGTKIAQLILERIATVPIIEKTSLNDTERGTLGFGSSDNSQPTAPITQPQTVTLQQSPLSHDPIPVSYEPHEVSPTIRSVSSPTHHIYLSDYPYGPTISIDIDVRGTHPTLGLSLDDRNMEGRLILTHMERSTPGHRIKRWRSTLRNSNLLRTDKEPVSIIQEVKDIIAQAKAEQKSTFSLTFATEERVSIHPDEGIPQIYSKMIRM